MRSNVIPLRGGRCLINAVRAELVRSEPIAGLDPALVLAAEWWAEQKRINERDLDEDEAAADAMMDALAALASRLYRTVPRSKEGLCAILDVFAEDREVDKGDLAAVFAAVKASVSAGWSHA
jgi:hypothetical protein